MTERRTILVTGCSSGIGAYCARALKEDGWRVFATARKPDDIARLAASGLEAFPLDYRDGQSIASLAEAVLSATGGRLDALFNNGGYAQAGAVEDVPVEALREQFEANVFGYHDLTRRFLPAMRIQGHGRLVHTSSILGLVPMKWRGAYVASKYALEGLMMTQRMELEGSGIHVSLIEPGPIDTAIASNSLGLIEKYIDIEASAYRDEYRRQMQGLGRRQPRNPARRLAPKPSMRVHGMPWKVRRPRPHYIVTRPARIGALDGGSCRPRCFTGSLRPVLTGRRHRRPVPKTKGSPHEFNR